MNHERIKEFYRRRIYQQGFPEPDELNNEQLFEIRKTNMYANWRIANYYDEVVEEMKDTLTSLSGTTPSEE